jgi:BlaI family penicillinase repressor
MDQRPELEITEAEWEVMLSVWQADDQPAGEIIARVEPIRNRSHRTVRTLLARLVEKGAVRVTIDGSRHLYSAAVSREECVRSAAKSFTERFFSGSFQSMLLHFVEHEQLSNENAEELKRRLDDRFALADKRKGKRKSHQRRKRK